MPLARGTKPLRRSAIKRHPEGLRFSHESVARRRQNRDYRTIRREYLAAHPFCQAYIAIHGLSESEIMRARDSIYGVSMPASSYFVFRGHRVPFAVQIHHRNKRSGRRLVDDRFFLAVCADLHEIIEDNKAWAREVGFLLPINADADGATPAGPGEETPALMLRRAEAPPLIIPS